MIMSWSDSLIGLSLSWRLDEAHDVTQVIWSRMMGSLSMTGHLLGAEWQNLLAASSINFPHQPPCNDLPAYHPPVCTGLGTGCRPVLLKACWLSNRTITNQELVKPFCSSLYESFIMCIIRSTKLDAIYECSLFGLIVPDYILKRLLKYQYMTNGE